MQSTRGYHAGCHRLRLVTATAGANANAKLRCKLRSRWRTVWRRGVRRRTWRGDWRRGIYRRGRRSRFKRKWRPIQCWRRPEWLELSVAGRALKPSIAFCVPQQNLQKPASMCGKPGNRCLKIAVHEAAAAVCAAEGVAAAIPAAVLADLANAPPRPVEQALAVHDGHAHFFVQRQADERLHWKLCKRSLNAGTEKADIAKWRNQLWHFSADLLPADRRHCRNCTRQTVGRRDQRQPGLRNCWNRPERWPKSKEDARSNGGKTLPWIPH